MADCITQQAHATDHQRCANNCTARRNNYCCRNRPAMQRPDGIEPGHERRVSSQSNHGLRSVPVGVATPTSVFVRNSEDKLLTARVRHSIPRHGAPKIERTRKAVATRTTTGPVGTCTARLLITTPDRALRNPTSPAITSIGMSRSVHCRATAGGITTSAVTKTAPAAGSPTTTITATTSTEISTTTRIFFQLMSTILVPIQNSRTMFPILLQVPMNANIAKQKVPTAMKGF